MPPRVLRPRSPKTDNHATYSAAEDLPALSGPGWYPHTTELLGLLRDTLGLIRQSSV